MRARLLIFIFSLLAVGFTWDGRASAAAPTGLTISPAFQMVTLQSGSTETPVTFQITNRRPVAQDLTFSVRDFNALNESGGLFFVGTNPTALQKKYGLAKWVSLPSNQLAIQPGQTATLNAQILNLPDLSGGGHYGALLISAGGGPTSGKVGFQPIASSLLFVTKPAGATHVLSLSDVNFKHSLFLLPAQVGLKFQNTGNTHVVPRGSVYIKDPHGKLVSKGIINANSNIILPQTYRLFNVNLQPIGTSSTIGKYNIHVDFRFDGVNQYRSYQTGVWHATALSIFVSIIVMLVIVLVILKVAKFSRTKR